MFDGRLLEIYVAATNAGPMRRLDTVEATPGQGLDGDRYSAAVSGQAPEPDQHVTLIESEALEAASQGYEIELAPGASRRNLVTRGVPLNHLVGHEFRVGESVVLRGHRLCEPCGHMEKLTVAGARKALVHRGGLRAEIVRGGTLRAGDAIRPLGPDDDSR